MIFDPGIIDAAKAAKVFVNDTNGNGHIDQSDLNAAIKAKATAQVAVATEVKK